MQLAHLIKFYFPTFKLALRAAWQIIKIASGRVQQITFVKQSTGEIREATVLAVSTLSTVKDGYLRFVEKVNDSQTQWRSFRIENMIV